MAVGRIIGKTTTTEFEFTVDAPLKKFEFIQVVHPEYKEVLCQVLELTKDVEKTVAKGGIVGYLDNHKRLSQIRSPFDPKSEVNKASPELIMSIIQIHKRNGAYIGMLEGTKIKVYADLNKLLTKHVAVLAKTGSGKSYAAGVLVEEILEKKVPLLIIDPHGEYASIREKTQDMESLDEYGVKGKSFQKEVREYGDPSVLKGVRQLYLNDKLDMGAKDSDE